MHVNGTTSHSVIFVEQHDSIHIASKRGSLLVHPLRHVMNQIKPLQVLEPHKD
jgi:hypothetical protein